MVDTTAACVRPLLGFIFIPACHMFKFKEVNALLEHSLNGCNQNNAVEESKQGSVLMLSIDQIKFNPL